MNKEVIEQIIAQIEKHDKIAIYRHVFPDPDSYGAQISLKEMIHESFEGKEVYLFGQHNEDLSYIGVMDDEASVVVDESWLGIIVDVGDAHRVDGDSFKQCGTLAKIDHHRPFSAPFEQYSWVDTNYPATCMMLLDMLLESEGKLKITKKGREAMYIGIVADTGRFEYLSNPTDVFSKIINITYDIDTKPLYASFYKRKMPKVKFLGYIYSNFEVRKNGVGILRIPSNIVTEFGLDTMEAARMVNSLKDTEGLVNWHFFAEDPASGKIMCEFRSSGPCVNEIAAKYGGGGHVLAGGATVESWDIVEKMIVDFEENCK